MQADVTVTTGSRACDLAVNQHTAKRRMLPPYPLIVSSGVIPGRWSRRLVNSEIEIAAVSLPMGESTESIQARIAQIASLITIPVGSSSALERQS